MQFLHNLNPGIYQFFRFIGYFVYFLGVFRHACNLLGQVIHIVQTVSCACFLQLRACLNLVYGAGQSFRHLIYTHIHIAHSGNGLVYGSRAFHYLSDQLFHSCNHIADTAAKVFEFIPAFCGDLHRQVASCGTFHPFYDIADIFSDSHRHKRGYYRHDHCQHNHG